MSKKKEAPQEKNFKMYDLDVTAEERGYVEPDRVEAPENELKDEPKG